MPTAVEQHADAKLDLDEFRAEMSDVYAARERELLDNPDERDPEIVDQWLGRLAERAAEELGDEALAEAYYERLADAVALSWDDLHNIPVAPRGAAHSAAQAAILGIARQQAFAEIMLPRIAELAEANGKRLGKVRNPDDLRGVRNTMKERAEIRAAAGAEKASATEPTIG